MHIIALRTLYVQHIIQVILCVLLINLFMIFFKNNCYNKSILPNYYIIIICLLGVTTYNVRRTM